MDTALAQRVFSSVVCCDCSPSPGILPPQYPSAPSLSVHAHCRHPHAGLRHCLPLQRGQASSDTNHGTSLVRLGLCAPSRCFKMSGVNREDALQACRLGSVAVGWGSPFCSLSLPPLSTAQAAMGSVGSQRLKEPSVAGTPDRSMMTSFSFDSCQLEEEEAAARAALGQGGRARGAPIFTDCGE